MKKFIVFICLLFSGLSAFAVDDTAEGSVSYDVFAPEKIFGAKLNAELTAKEDCNFFLLPVSSDGVAYASNVAIPPLNQSLDPYIFKYKGINYIFMLQGSKALQRQNILGINDTKETLFASLIELDKNNDNKITPDELKKSNIRLVKISDKGKLILKAKQDFDINRISYIDLSEIKSITNSTATGINGHFYIYLKNVNEKIIGLVISADDDIINNLF